MVRSESLVLLPEPKGGMELNYPHCPSICPCPLGTERASAVSRLPRTEPRLEYLSILLILGRLGCDKISTQTDPLKEQNVQ